VVIRSRCLSSTYSVTRKYVTRQCPPCGGKGPAFYAGRGLSAIADTSSWETESYTRCEIRSALRPQTPPPCYRTVPLPRGGRTACCRTLTALRPQGRCAGRVHRATRPAAGLGEPLRILRWDGRFGVVRPHCEPIQRCPVLRCLATFHPDTTPPDAAWHRASWAGGSPTRPYSVRAPRAVPAARQQKSAVK
jgi:hypothetical protein